MQTKFAAIDVVSAVLACADIIAEKTASTEEFKWLDLVVFNPLNFK